MADALYLLTLRITQKLHKFMNQEEKKMVEEASFFVSVCYAPWFLKTYLVAKAPANDLNSFKEAFEIEKEYPTLGKALIESLHRHSWYLTEDLILLACADDDIEEDVKLELLRKLGNCYERSI